MKSRTSRKNGAPRSSVPAFRRLHQERCGYGRIGYDNYADVLEACERKLAQWEKEGVLAPYRPMRPNDWLFRP